MTTRTEADIPPPLQTPFAYGSSHHQAPIISQRASSGRGSEEQPRIEADIMPAGNEDSHLRCPSGQPRAPFALRLIPLALNRISHSLGSYQPPVDRMEREETRE